MHQLINFNNLNLILSDYLNINILIFKIKNLCSENKNYTVIRIDPPQFPNTGHLVNSGLIHNCIVRL